VKLEKLKTWYRSATPYLVVMWLALLFVIVLFWSRIFVSIKPGEAGILWLRFKGGTVIDKVYDEGFHVICPWDKMQIYDVRIQSVPQEINVLSKNGLRITLKLIIRYQPQYDVLGVLHKRVGPDYVERIVIPEVESSLRTTIGNYDSEEVYTAQNTIVSKIINEAGNSAAHRYVHIDSVIIREIILPQTIQQAIEQKVEQQELAKAYVYRIEREQKEAERRRIEADGLRVANEILNASITQDLLTWRGIEATKDLASSSNSKMIVIGSGKGGMPLILNPDSTKP
jgi:regulator of protease activity HflC (stomatin/prohibitin superfamily)